MPVSVAIENVTDPLFLRVSDGLKTRVPGADGQPTTFSVAMEVYTGVVAPDFFGTDTNILQDEIRTFLPFEPMKIKAYPRGSIKDVTATASLATITGAEDEAVLVGVDRVVSVQLESQANLGECLVMRVELAALNAHILRYTYQVTLLVGEGAKIEELDPLNAGTGPA